MHQFRNTHISALVTLFKSIPGTMYFHDCCSAIILNPIHRAEYFCVSSSEINEKRGLPEGKTVQWLAERDTDVPVLHCAQTGATANLGALARLPISLAPLRTP